jgi:integrase/recombinase XerD
MTPLAPHLTVFLREYLPNQREMSQQTSDTYAYAFQLLVCFAAELLKTTPSALFIGLLYRDGADSTDLIKTCR